MARAVLIITIIVMILISIQPFGVRKILLIAVALFWLSAVCFADSVFMARRYSARVRVDREVDARGGSREQQFCGQGLTTLDSSWIALDNVQRVISYGAAASPERCNESRFYPAASESDFDLASGKVQEVPTLGDPGPTEVGLRLGQR
jgi:hypothetical protein